MKHTLPAMILAKPAGFYAYRSWFARAKGAHEFCRRRFTLHAPKKNFLQFRKPLGEIREQLYRDFAFISARPQNPRHHNPPGPSLILAAQSSNISSVNPFRIFVPAAVKTVRIALAVRPCSPITLTRSSG